MICYALVSNRQTVAALAELESPGRYHFISITKVCEVAGAAATSTTSVSRVDAAILDLLGSVTSADSRLPAMLMQANPDIASVDNVSFFDATGTLEISVTTTASDADVRNAIAFVVTDVASGLWEGATVARLDGHDPAPTRGHGRRHALLVGLRDDDDIADGTMTYADWIELTGVGESTASERFDPRFSQRFDPRRRQAALSGRLAGRRGGRAYSRGVERALHRIAIVNRGEAAMRLVNAVSELRHELSRDIGTIALHAHAERAAMFVRESDAAVCIDDHRSPDAPGSPYLDLDALGRALKASGADAAWVGWGFVAERPEFAELCDELGIVFVGPPPAVMRSLGDKIGAKLLAEKADVPVAPWSGGAVDTLEDDHVRPNDRVPADGEGDRRWRRTRDSPRRPC